jgi:hypothetical protein
MEYLKVFRVAIKIMTKALGFTVGLNAKELTVKEWVELGKELVTLSKKINYIYNNINTGII